jgi:hypothetical protein
MAALGPKAAIANRARTPITPKHQRCHACKLLIYRFNFSGDSVFSHKYTIGGRHFAMTSTTIHGAGRGWDCAVTRTTAPAPRK